MQGPRFAAVDDGGRWSIVDRTAPFAGGRVLTGLDERTALEVTAAAEADPDRYDAPFGEGDAF